MGDGIPACGSNQVHVFQALPCLSTEAAQAMAYAARFVTNASAANAIQAELIGAGSPRAQARSSTGAGKAG
jgi:hypothetical protein